MNRGSGVRMWRLACVLAAATSASPSIASSVLWGFLEYQGEWEVETGVMCQLYSSESPGGLAVRPAVAMTVDRKLRTQVEISGYDHGVDLEHSDSWVILDEGQVACEETTRHLTEQFLKNGIDDWENWVSNQSIKHSIAPFRFYLGLATASINCWRPEDPYNPVFDEVYYGWALFEWSKNQLSLVDSALCLEPNTGIIVGSSTIVPIPEPSSCALAALGVAALLRRRHGNRLQGSPCS